MSDEPDDIRAETMADALEEDLPDIIAAMRLLAERGTLQTVAKAATPPPVVCRLTDAQIIEGLARNRGSDWYDANGLNAGLIFGAFARTIRQLQRHDGAR